MTTETPKGTAPEPDADAPRAGASGANADRSFGDAAKRIGEIREYIAYYMAAQADRLKLILRRGIFCAAFAVLGLAAAAAGVVMAVVLFFLGAARGLGAAMGGREWLGDLVVGGIILGGMAIAARIGVYKVFGFFSKNTVEKYESRKREQRDRFGHDVEQRAES